MYLHPDKSLVIALHMNQLHHLIHLEWLVMLHRQTSE